DELVEDLTDRHRIVRRQRQVDCAPDGIHLLAGAPQALCGPRYINARPAHRSTPESGDKKTTRRGMPARVSIFVITPSWISSICAISRQISCGSGKSDRLSSGRAPSSTSSLISSHTRVSLNIGSESFTSRPWIEP